MLLVSSLRWWRFTAVFPFALAFQGPLHLQMNLGLNFHEASWGFERHGAVPVHRLGTFAVVTIFSLPIHEHLLPSLLDCSRLVYRKTIDFRVSILYCATLSNTVYAFILNWVCFVFYYTHIISSQNGVLKLSGIHPLGSLPPHPVLLWFPCGGGLGGAAPSTLGPLRVPGEALAPENKLAHHPAHFPHPLNDFIDKVNEWTNQ